jgi:Fe-S-cluster containining protein
MSNPCLSCGACCAHFRASFHWLETNSAPGGLTPAELTVPVSRHLVAMRGTDRNPPRCIALDGRIGESVRCTIYEQRASPCREFRASWVDGQHNERCDRARAVHGLPPLPPPLQPPLPLPVAAADGSVPLPLSEAGGPGPCSGAAVPA